MQTIDFTDKKLYVDWIEELTQPLYNPNIRYIFLKGGAGAGKSYAVAQLLVQNILDGSRVACFRKVGATLRASVFQLLKDIVYRWNLGKYFDVRVSTKEIEPLHAPGLLSTFGLDDPEKIKSIANYDWFRIEEATELTYDDFTQLDLRLRGGKNHKIICTFNPVSSRHRLKTSVLDQKRDKTVWIMKTARDNKFVGKEYLEQLEALKEKNEKHYKIYALNEWGESVEGLVYSGYETFSHDIEPEVIGLDFGWNDPNALVYLKREDIQGTRKKLYCQEKIYASELTAKDLVLEMQRINVPKQVLIIADSARPEMIAEIKKAGYKIEPVKKYAGSITDQIQTVQQYDLVLNGVNIIREVAGYMWKKDKDGVILDIPEDGQDHTIDGIRYACTYFSKPKRLGFIG